MRGCRAEKPAVTDPYRAQVERAFCCQRIPLPIPEIEVDGSERWHEVCREIARQRCPRCEAPLCDVHVLPAGGCSACETQFARSVGAVPGEAALLTRRERTTRITLCLTLAAAAPPMVWLALDALRDPGTSSWILALGGALVGLAVHISSPLLEDNLRRRRRREFLRRPASASARARTARTSPSGTAAPAPSEE